MSEIERIVAMILSDERSIVVLSCGEKIAAALLFNRLYWIPEGYKHPLDAISRLVDVWLNMAIDYHRKNS